MNYLFVYREIVELVDDDDFEDEEIDEVVIECVDDYVKEDVEKVMKDVFLVVEEMISMGSDGEFQKFFINDYFGMDNIDGIYFICIQQKVVNNFLMQ